MGPGKFIIILILACSCSTDLSAQAYSNLKTGLVSFYQKYPQEKTYVQTDKDAYISGQSVWFSIYALAYGVPSELSKIVYVQLVNPEGKVVIQKKLQLDSGTAHGDLLLPDTLHSNMYELRCYTSWMLNFDESFIFHKHLLIVNPAGEIPDGSGKPTEGFKNQLRFFPEGGDLIDHDSSDIAFKATDDNGFPVMIAGEIKDESGNVITGLHVIHDGMGEFSIVPDGKHYFADVKFANGTNRSIQLPDSKAFGITLKVIEQNDSEIIIDIFHHDQYKDQFKNLIVAAYQNTGKVAVYPIEIGDSINLFSFLKSEFSNGVFRLTVFSKEGLPLAERVVFLDKKDELKVNLANDSLSFNPRKKNQFTVQLDTAGFAIDKAAFSVTITDADKTIDEGFSDNIFSSLLLSSELKGNIHNPSYYFQNHEDSTKKALDLVMMTNGWRHFVWDDLVQNKKVSLKYPVEKEQYIEGEVLKYNKALYKNVKLKLVIQNEDSSKFIGYAVPDSSGRFALHAYPVSGKSIIFFQGASNKIKEQNIKIRFFISTQDSFRTAPYLLSSGEHVEMNPVILASDSDEANYNLKEQKNLLKPVTIRALAPSKMDKLISKYVSPYFYADYVYSIDLINNFYPNSIGMFLFLKGRFPSLGVGGTEDSPQFSYRGEGSSSRTGPSGGSVPYFYVDEMLTTWQDVENIPLSEVALIQFLPPPVPIAPFNGGFMGVISVYLKKWDEMPEDNITANYNRYSFSGFSVTREFSSPDYSKRNPDGSISDFRSTLYWNPHLMPDGHGKMTFHFYNSDKAKKFRIIFEGIDGNGRIASFIKVLGQD